MKEIQLRSSIDATVRIPGSKSITHRSAIAASLATGESKIRGFLPCEDTLYTISVLRELGIQISMEGEDIKVIGSGGRFVPSSNRKEFYLGNSGTSMRLLVSTVSLAKGEFLLTGSPQMLSRPIEELVDALNQLGVEALCLKDNSSPPVLIRTEGIKGGRVTMSGEKSSQYISSLLLSGPYAEKGIEIEVTGRLVSGPYVDITIEVMRRFGISVIRDGYRYFRIPASNGYRSYQFSVEGDLSAASYFWAAAAVTGGMVTTENIRPHSTKQGDIGFLEIIKEMGCQVRRETDRVIVYGGALSGIEVDMGAMPDMVPTLSAIALFANGKTVIRNVSHLRHKESNRLRAIALEWNKLGGRVEELGDGLIIHGGRRLCGTTVESHYDHRLAMSLSVVGLKVPGIKIKDEHCVNKSFPRFWELWDRL
jgi:3-phosphoshikimate 1-carboxyvinyltransferase